MPQIEMTPVETAFGKLHQLELESGQDIMIPKWGVKKTIRLGGVITRILSQFFNLVRSHKDGDGDELNITALDAMVALPELMERSADDLAAFIEEALTLPNGDKQLTAQQVLGEGGDDSGLSFEDFPDVLLAIIQVNLTPKAVGKWKALWMEGMMGIFGETKSSPSKKKK